MPVRSWLRLCVIWGRCNDEDFEPGGEVKEGSVWKRCRSSSRDRVWVDTEVSLANVEAMDKDRFSERVSLRARRYYVSGLYKTRASVWR